MNGFLKMLVLFSLMGIALEAHSKDKVVVIPLGSSENTFAGEATISIPVSALKTSNGENLNFFSPIGSLLEDTGSTTFGTTFIIPLDHKPDTLVYVDIFVYNPLENGACQAIIRSNYGRSWKPGEPRDGTAVFGFASQFPAFSQGDQTYMHTFRFGQDKGAGDIINFGMFRAGDLVEDDCGDVGLVGLNIRYRRE